jgi:hypothetical protein
MSITRRFQDPVQGGREGVGIGPEREAVREQQALAPVRMTGHERQRVHGTATAGEDIRRPWSRSEINRCSRPHPSAAGASHRSGGQDALTAVLVVGSLVMAGLAVRLTGSLLLGIGVGIGAALVIDLLILA